MENKLLRQEMMMKIALIASVLLLQWSWAFVVVPTVTRTRRQQPFFAASSTTSTDNHPLPPIDSMRAGEMKQELASYGISTAAFLEKQELVDALTKARADGLQPKHTTTASSASSSGSSTTSSSSAGTSRSTASPSDDDNKTREQRLQEELVACQAMKASELKNELKERGISTTTFLEKFEFVQALAQARVDGVTKKTTNDDEEGYAEYSNVEVLTDDASGPRPRQQQQQEQEQQQQSSPFGGGANPFGGGANPFGGGANPFGGGGMGGIADMLKNMGVGGGTGASPSAGGANPFAGGANPFAGGASPFAGGTNPFGNMDSNAFGKAQQMMQNPKVQQILAKAQSNPRIMAKVNECMSNPASFAKYQNDPEVAELIQELKKYT